MPQASCPARTAKGASARADKSGHRLGETQSKRVTARVAPTRRLPHLTRWVSRVIESSPAGCWSGGG